ncbi:hypothetical protein FI667_g7965, partial [Globisporangium splendens]
MTIPNVKSKDGTRGTLMHPFDVAVDAEMRWGALWKLALGAVAMQAYCAPLRVLEREYAGANESAQLQQQNPEGMLHTLRIERRHSEASRRCVVPACSDPCGAFGLGRTTDRRDAVVAERVVSLEGAQRRVVRHLKQFFKQHDAQFVPLVDRLLEEYTGNERLLYARIRRLYRDKKTSAHLKTP